MTVPYRTSRGRRPATAVGLALTLGLSLAACQPLTGPDAPAPRPSAAFTIEPTASAAWDSVPSRLRRQPALWQAEIPALGESTSDAISPDGRTFAMLTRDPEGTFGVVLVDLWTGYATPTLRFDSLSAAHDGQRAGTGEPTAQIVGIDGGFAVLEGYKASRSEARWAAHRIDLSGEVTTTGSGVFDNTAGYLSLVGDEGLMYLVATTETDQGEHFEPMTNAVIVIDAITGAPTYYPATNGSPGDSATCSHDECRTLEYPQGLRDGESLTTELRWWSDGGTTCEPLSLRLGYGTPNPCVQKLVGPQFDSATSAPQGAKSDTSFTLHLDLETGLAVLLWPQRDDQDQRVLALVDPYRPGAPLAVAHCPHDSLRLVPDEDVNIRPDGRYVSTGFVVFDLETGQGACLVSENYSVFWLSQVTVDNEGIVRGAIAERSSAFRARIPADGIHSTEPLEYEMYRDALAPFTLQNVPSVGDVAIFQENGSRPGTYAIAAFEVDPPPD
ncbi:hypothetical protein JT358_03540 [Micrococcales bacterium 31B]|nr:hypothetical protein [Micrococcales bacterium 31B]